MKYIRHRERGSGFLKKADRYIGIPIVRLLGIFSRKAPLPTSQVKRIAILKTAGIGDTVILSAVINDIKRTLHDSEITFICGQNNFEISHILCSIDRVVVLQIRNPFKSIKTIRSLGQFDLWLDFGPWPRFNSLMSYCANSLYKIGFRTRKQYRHYVYDMAVEHLSDCHELTNYRNIAAAAGIKCRSLPTLSLNRAPCSSIIRTSLKTGGAPGLSFPQRRESFVNMGSPIKEIGDNKPETGLLDVPINNKVVLHIFPGGSLAHLKEWPAHHWIRLIDWLSDNRCTIYLTGGVHDHGRLEKLTRSINARDNVVIVAGRYSLLETAKLLAESRLVVSIDTGTMHMASALGCNLIAIHGPTSSKRWGPLNPGATLIESHRACAPCIDLGFDSDCRNNKCMAEIKPEIVIDACMKMLNIR